MSSQPSVHNLLFGIVALRMNLISRVGLLAATSEWVNDKTRTLRHVLLAKNALTYHEITLIDAEVARSSERYADDERNLAEWLLMATSTATAENGHNGVRGVPVSETIQAAISVGQPARSSEPAPPSRTAGTAREPRTETVGAASRYHVLWAHAKGGLGEIFVAEDQELHRRVALKEIQPNHAQNPASRERFVVEAEVTGNLEHPGIVPVYGMGTYVDGRPYYTMRFIKGEDLTAAIRRFHAGAAPDFMGLEFRWLLRRFTDACNPVAYAHSRGILHRDLKPSNIMLGPFGETLVMDWGVAKLVGRGEFEDDISVDSPLPRDESAIRPRRGNGSMTLAGQAVGTPVYMSPEQAAGRPEALGPASDVYSLGATLYVVLTDRRPFAGEPNDVLRDVQHGNFPAPREIKPSVPKALDAICRRAMALDPSQRYRSALALAGDIERWLADEPVSAWDDPWTDLVRRWIRRNQPLVAGWAAAVAVALLSLAMAVPLLSLAWGNEAAARRIERQQRILAFRKAAEAQEQHQEAVRNLETTSREHSRAQANETKANEEKERAEKALEFLVKTFRRPDPSVDGHSLKVVDFLDQAVKDLESSLSDEPVMKATLLSAIGETFVGVGMPRESLVVLQRAVALRREKLGEDHVDTLKASHNLARAYEDAGRLDQAIPIMEATLAKRRAKLGDQNSGTIDSMNDLAVAFWEAGQTAKAIPLYETTLATVCAKLGADHLDTLTIADNLAVAYAAIGRTDEAIRLHEANLARLRAKLGDDHLATLITMNNLARAYETGPRAAESVRLYEATLPKLRTILGDDHLTTLTTMHNLARAYQTGGRTLQAIPLYEITRAKRRSKLGDDHPDTLMTTFELANAYLAAEQPRKAIPLARDFLERTAKIEDRLPAKVRDVIPRAKRLWETKTVRPPVLAPDLDEGEL